MPKTIHKRINILFSEVRFIKRRLYDIEITQRRMSSPKDMVAINKVRNQLDLFLSLPDRLRKSVDALLKLNGEGTASQVSKITGRVRAVESSNLNTLILLGWCNKFQKGRSVVFLLKESDKLFSLCEDNK